MLAHLPVEPASSVCDLGCGAGTLGLAYASKVVSSVDFVDDSAGRDRMAQEIGLRMDLRRVGRDSSPMIVYGFYREQL